MAAGGINRTGNARNNFLYGTQGYDTLDGGAGSDYLRGYAGDDELWGGAGSDRFVFERTLAQNGVDVIKDYVYVPDAGGGELDVLDFSLVGFARNALSRNGGTVDGIDNVVRFVADDNGARVEVSLTGAGGESYETWAVLEGLYAGDMVHFRIGAHTYTRPVQGLGGAGLRYDIGNDDRNGDGVPDEADDDDRFDDPLIVPDGEGGTMGAEVLIGDRVRGFGGTTPFTPGETAIDVPAWILGYSDGDALSADAYQVYYGTYDAATDIFTVTSTPGTTADPTSATHTMVLFDNDLAPGLGELGGRVFQGVYAESQWFIDYDTDTLQYDMDGFFSLQEVSVLDTENVLYGTGGDESFDGGDGIDIIYAAAGNDRLFGGSTYIGLGNEGETLPPDGNDWLFGGAGADIFFATNVLEGGFDTIKDFNGTEGDVIALADFPIPVWIALQSSDPLSEDPSWWSLAQARMAELGGLYDLGTVAGASLEAALLAESAPGGGINTEGAPFNVYRLQHNGKDYLFWDALGNGYTAGGDYDDTVVEITGAVNVNEGNIYLNLWQGGMGT